MTPNYEYIISYSSSFLEDNNQRFLELLSDFYRQCLNQTMTKTSIDLPLTFVFTGKNGDYSLTIAREQCALRWYSLLPFKQLNKNDFHGTIYNMCVKTGKMNYIKVTINDIEDIFAHIVQISEYEIGKKPHIPMSKLIEMSQEAYKAGRFEEFNEIMRKMVTSL